MARHYALRKQVVLFKMFCSVSLRYKLGIRQARRRRPSIGQINFSGSSSVYTFYQQELMYLWFYFTLAFSLSTINHIQYPMSYKLDKIPFYRMIKDGR